MGTKKVLAVLFIVIAVSATIAYIAGTGSLFSPPAPNLIYAPTMPSSNEKVVCLLFDDGWKSHLEAASVLASYNFTATFPIITSYVGYPAYMSWEDISTLAKQGNDIVSHTQTHLNLSAVDEQTLQSELANSQQVLRSKGYATDVLVYPYGEGATNWTVRNLVAQYYSVASTTQSGKCSLSSFDRYNVASYGIYRNTTLTEFTSYLNGTQGDTITVLYYHKVSDENLDTAVTMEAFQSQMQYLKDNGFIIRTISQEFLKPE
ncbi:MAG: polysaccharide deacetylase family protein [Candidatus Bathyarchaeia archaeon]|jgi:peptidoglycan/xylan/chitin deacetylase (PgdA/CDA1 family)